MKETSSEIIKRLGGAAAVGRLLGLPKKSSTQVVHNWRSRGIPWKILSQYPEIFGNVKRDI